MNSIGKREEEYYITLGKTQPKTIYTDLIHVIKSKEVCDISLDENLFRSRS